MALRRKFTQTKLFQALIVFGIILLIVFFPPRFLYSPLRTMLAALVWPIESSLSFLAFEARDSIGFFSSIGRLKDENERLEKERIRLLAENARCSGAFKENEILRGEIGLSSRKDFDLSAAEVIGRDMVGLGNSILIDRGSFHGIVRGMPVVVSSQVSQKDAVATGQQGALSSGVLVGQIEEVFFSSARVMLVSDPESRINAVAPETGARGIVNGEHGLSALFDMVPQTDTIHSGDVVMTSGLGGDMPEGLLIGVLQDPSFSGDKLFQSAPVVFPMKLDKIRYVFVIKNSVTP